MSSTTTTASPNSVSRGRWVTIATPDGPFTVVADPEDRVLASGWTADPAYLTALVHRSIRPIELDQADDLDTIREAVESYYDGRHHAIDKIEVTQKSGPFLERAWKVLRTISPGDPVTYTAFAELAGEPAAIRAAATACARNAAALFVPCHRVLRSDGTLGGFRYGLAIKESLLARESTD